MEPATGNILHFQNLPKFLTTWNLLLSDAFRIEYWSYKGCSFCLIMLKKLKSSKSCIHPNAPLLQHQSQLGRKRLYCNVINDSVKWEKLLFQSMKQCGTLKHLNCNPFNLLSTQALAVLYLCIRHLLNCHSTFCQMFSPGTNLFCCELFRKWWLATAMSKWCETPSLTPPLLKIGEYPPASVSWE